MSEHEFDGELQRALQMRSEEVLGDDPVVPPPLLAHRLPALRRKTGRAGRVAMAITAVAATLGGGLAYRVVSNQGPDRPIVVTPNASRPRYVLADPEFVAVSSSEEPTVYVMERGLQPIGSVQLTDRNAAGLASEATRQVTLSSGKTADVGNPAGADGSCAVVSDWFASWTLRERPVTAYGCGFRSDAEIASLADSFFFEGEELRTSEPAESFTLSKEPGSQETDYISDTEFVTVRIDFETVQPSDAVEPFKTDTEREVNGSKRTYKVDRYNEPGSPVFAEYVADAYTLTVSGEMSDKRLVELADKVQLASSDQRETLDAQLDDPNKPVVLGRTQIEWGPDADGNNRVGAAITALLLPAKDGRCRTVSLRVSRHIAWRTAKEVPARAEDACVKMSDDIHGVRVIDVDDTTVLFAELPPNAISHSVSGFQDSGSTYRAEAQSFLVPDQQVAVLESYPATDPGGKIDDDAWSIAAIVRESDGTQRTIRKIAKR